jgi:phosphopantothenoylcysteine decarboxylase/phosphopantothenate--cysteine ligase
LWFKVFAMLNGKKILLGIGGGIAVYKVAELARMLTKAGADVRCVMTKSACKFVTPLTFEALTGNQVYAELFDLTAERQMGHITLARWADAVIIAPATASLLARLAHGIADDLFTTIMQVCEAPVLLAPAMNTSMWESEATQRNMVTLSERGMHTVGPDEGELACGELGAGRLADIRAILSELLPILSDKPFIGQHWVINAGPTMEAWDDVRILSNRASGMLGALLADLACIMGASVSLVAGPGTPDTHPGVIRRNVSTALEMLTICELEAARASVFIATAAVSDFRFAESVQGKLKRGDTTNMTVELTANPDIVARIAAMPARPDKVIAFAAESDNHIDHAKAKLSGKKVDAIVANDIANMGSEQAGGWWISKHGEHIAIETGSKLDFAKQIIQHITELPR